jgi:hypothetical protein
MSILLQIMYANVYKIVAQLSPNARMMQNVTNKATPYLS